MQQIILVVSIGLLIVISKLSCKSGVGALHDSLGRLVTDDKQCASMLNDFFSSVCSQDNGSVPNLEYLHYYLNAWKLV